MTPRSTPRSADHGRSGRPSTNRKPPAYRRRKGYTQAIVTLTDAVTKRRKDYWLGEYGSPESRELYYRVLAEYEAIGRRLPDLPDAAPATTSAATGGPDVDELALQYWRRVAREFLPKRCNAIEATLRLLRQMDGSTRAAQAVVAHDGKRPGADRRVGLPLGVTQEIVAASVGLVEGVADVVTCFDALEHLLPEDVNPVLAEMRRITRSASPATPATRSRPAPAVRE